MFVCRYYMANHNVFQYKHLIYRLYLSLIYIEVKKEQIQRKFASFISFPTEPSLFPAGWYMESFFCICINLNMNYLKQCATCWKHTVLYVNIYHRDRLS